MTEDEEREKKARVAAAAGGLVALVVGIWYVKTAPQRRKLKKIREWKLMQFDAIKNAADHLIYVHGDPNTTNEKFAELVKDEKSFLNIVRNQPKPS